VIRPSIGARITLLVWSFAFVGIFGTILPASLPEVRLITQILYGSTLALWAALRLGRSRTPLDYPILAGLVLLLVTSTLSRDPQGSLNMLGGGLALALLYWLMADVRSPALRGSIALGVMGALTSWLIIFAVRWTLEKVTWASNGGGMPNLLESTQTLLWLTTNAVPVLALLGFGFMGYMPPGAGSRLLARAFIVASIITVPMSGGRTAWLGLGIAAVMLLALRSGRVRQALTTRRIMLGAAVIAAIPIAITVLGVTGPYITGLSARLPLWREALSILVSDPLTGGGPGTFAWVRLEHIPEHHIPVPAALTHNVPLQTLADGGLLLFVGLGTLVATTLHAAWQRRQELSSDDQSALAVLLGFGVVCLLDDHSSLPAITAMAVTMTAWITVGPRQDRPPTGAWTRLATYAAVALVAIIALPAVARVDVGRLTAATGRGALTAGDPAGGIAAFSSAVDWYPSNAQYHLSLGLALSLDTRADEAREHFRRAADLSPGDARSWGALAALATDDRERRRLLEIASVRPTADPQYAYRLAQELESEGELDQAQQAYVHAVFRLPSLVLTLTPGSDPTSREGVADAVDWTAESLGPQARLSPDQARWDLALAGVRSVTDLPPAWRALMALQRNDLPVAIASLEEAIAGDPWSNRTWRVARAIADFTCDVRLRSEAELLMSLTTGGRADTERGLIQETVDLAYREDGLGSYQPSGPSFPPDLIDWPGAYLETPPPCAAWVGRQDA